MASRKMKVVRDGCVKLRNAGTGREYWFCSDAGKGKLSVSGEDDEAIKLYLSEVETRADALDRLGKLVGMGPKNPEMRRARQYVLAVTDQE